MNGPRGCTGPSRLAPGERYLATARQIGEGAASFERAADGLLAWRMHELAGVHVRGRHGVAPRAAEVGAVVSVRLGPTALRLVGLCRVEDLVVTDHEVALTYRTLDEHVEDGVQTFRVVRCEDGAIEGTIESWSQARHPVLRRLGPVGMLGQQLVADRYLGALARLAAGESGRR